ncbi:hypothetical protein GW17_00043520 [Ensete ventricosum]|nr:hypothetical protein GW17_00043520 [Ensete ventricosum]
MLTTRRGSGGSKVAARSCSGRGVVESGCGSEGSNNKGGGSGVMRSADSNRQRRGGTEEEQRQRFGAIDATRKEEGTRVPRWQRGVAVAAREDGNDSPTVTKKRKSMLRRRRASMRGSGDKAIVEGYLLCVSGLRPWISDGVEEAAVAGKSGRRDRSMGSDRRDLVRATRKGREMAGMADGGGREERNRGGRRRKRRPRERAATMCEWKRASSK